MPWSALGNAPAAIADADSHIMEVPGWLEKFANPSIKERLGAFPVTYVEQERTADPSAPDFNVLADKGWHALGSIDPTERAKAIDLLGFSFQLVFPSFSHLQFLFSNDGDVVTGGAEALNRGLVEFCSHDSRLLPVALIPLLDGEQSASMTRAAVDAGAKAILLPSALMSEVAPSHPSFWPFWEALEELNTPFVLHLGGGGRSIDKRFANNGLTQQHQQPLGEPSSAAEFLTFHYAPATFLSSLVIDGVLEKFPGVRGGCIEQNALWVISWLRQLDLAQQLYGGIQPEFGKLPMKPSEYVTRQLKFTPSMGEPLEWMIEQTSERLFLFSTDYPHIEGGTMPVQLFDRLLGRTSPEARNRFYYENFTELVGLGT